MILTYDMTAWDQKKKNMRKAMVVRVLHANGITHDKINMIPTGVEVINPSSDPTSVATQAAVEVSYADWLVTITAANDAAKAESDAKEAELAVNEFQGIKMADIDAKIDSIQNVSHVRTALKKIVRYIIAKG